LDSAESSVIPIAERFSPKMRSPNANAILETGLYEAWRWDAFVAPDGAPISLWFDRRNPMPRPIYSRPDFSALEDEEPESNGDVGNGTKIPPA